MPKRFHRQAGSTDDVIANRQRHITGLRMRGYTQREIHKALPNLTPPCINPETDKPWSLGIIAKDLLDLKNEWRNAALEDMGDMQGTILAELREVRRAAWSKSDLSTILKALKQECELLGLDKPIKIAPVDAEGNSLRVSMEEMSADDLAQFVGLVDRFSTVSEN